MKPGLGGGWLLAAMLLAVCGCSANAPEAAEPVAAGPQALAAPVEPPGVQPGEVQQGESRHLAAAVGADSRRYALVFGNGAYRHGDALAAPARDAALMARALQARGYHVLVGTDRDLAGMREDIAAFAEMSHDAELRLFYFAGHGFEFDSANYLMPVDLPTGIASLDEREVHTHALRLDQLVWELEQDAPVLVAVIDACRVPPTRGVVAAQALRAQEPPEGTILAYATAPGRVAMDSLRAYGVDEEHSPYTYYLADALLSPGVERWDQAFQVAYSIVNHRTDGAQQPWMNARVNQFPAVGQLQSASTAGAASPFGPAVSAERRAAGRYWADEALAARRLANDRSRTDSALQRQADAGESRAAMALATRWSEIPGREQEAVGVLQPLAEEGNAAAQLDLGTLLYALAAEDHEGRSARYWWAQASAQGVGEARAKLAMLDGDATHVFEEFMRGMWEHYEAFAPPIPGARP